MLKPIMRAREHRATLVPDYLLVVQESDSEQAVEDLPGELRGMPHVGSLQGRDQLESFRPIRPGVPADGGLVVTLGSVLHVALLGRPATVQAGPVAPFRIELNSIWWISDHQPRL